MANENRTTTNANRPLRRVLAVAGVAAALAALVTVGIDVPLRTVGPHGGGMGPGRGMAPLFEPVVRAKVFVSTFNLAVLVALVWSYLSLYRDLPNRFTGSLLVVTLALLFYALSSNPVVPLLFGYMGSLGLGPFTFLPDLFAAVAVLLLLYQSYQ